MLGLLVTTLATSAVDSINPIAITQQFVLQGMVKKAKHIWFFIFSISITNLLAGLVAYLGLFTLLESFFAMLAVRTGRLLWILEFLLGIGVVLLALYLLRKGRRAKVMPQKTESSIEESTKRKIRSVAPAMLVLIGVTTTISELTTALPYYAFLAILSQQQVALPGVMLILVLYNMIYVMPQIIMYIVYVKAQKKFDAFYAWVKSKMSALSTVLGPLVCGIVGVVLLAHSTLNYF